MKPTSAKPALRGFKRQATIPPGVIIPRGPVLPLMATTLQGEQVGVHGSVKNTTGRTLMMKMVMMTNPLWKSVKNSRKRERVIIKWKMQWEGEIWDELWWETHVVIINVNVGSCFESIQLIESSLVYRAKELLSKENESLEWMLELSKVLPTLCHATVTAVSNLDKLP